MAVYSIRKAGAAITPDTGTVAFLTMITATTRKLRVQEISMSGLGNASAANEIQVCASPAGTTPGGAITPFPQDPGASVAAGFTTATTWATAPVVPAAGGLAFGVNANGGTYRWLAKTNFELLAQDGVTNYKNMSVKVVSGGSTCSFHTIVEEL